MPQTRPTDGLPGPVSTGRPSGRVPETKAERDKRRAGYLRAWNQEQQAMKAAGRWRKVV